MRPRYTARPFYYSRNPLVSANPRTISTMPNFDSTKAEYYKEQLKQMGMLETTTVITPDYYKIDFSKTSFNFTPIALDNWINIDISSTNFTKTYNLNLSNDYVVIYYLIVKDLYNNYLNFTGYLMKYSSSVKNFTININYNSSYVNAYLYTGYYNYNPSYPIFSRPYLDFKNNTDNVIIRTNILRNNYTELTDNPFQFVVGVNVVDSNVAYNVQQVALSLP